MRGDKWRMETDRDIVFFLRGILLGVLYTLGIIGLAPHIFIPALEWLYAW